jgi:signal peptidase
MNPNDDSSQNTLFGRIQWLMETDHPIISFIREVARTVFSVALVGLVIFSISGVWPPMVAVESGSMQPEMYRGDLIYVVEEHRFTPEVSYKKTGVVTHQIGAESGYKTFDGHGDVIIYKPHGDAGQTPVIHRARFWVNSSENWYSKANPKYLDGDSCAEVSNCPAPHSGFITKGDNNDYYDQVKDISSPVRPDWIIGTAEIRIPDIGHIRLAVS